LHLARIEGTPASNEGKEERDKEEEREQDGVGWKQSSFVGCTK
jgi:hypothetical protein